jgi:DNA modification methylase
MSGGRTEGSTRVLGAQNTLVLSDALLLVERVPSRSVDLCYIDPPLFPKIDSDSTSARPRMMREHLLALAKVLQHGRRCLAPTGSLFVHSEPEMNGSIRLLLDQVFGRENFRQEIVVPRPASPGRVGLSVGHDTVFHFSVGQDFVFNPQVRELTSEEIYSQFSGSDERGPFRLASLVVSVTRPSLAFEWRGNKLPPGKSWKYTAEHLEQLHDDGRIVIPSTGEVPRLKQYAAESPGIDIGSIWDDLPLRLAPAERSNYPTQKPQRLAERIIKMGSSDGALVLDPYCGSGTTLVAASKAGRRWIGGDCSPDAISLSLRRLRDECGLELGNDFICKTEEELLAVAERLVVPPLRIATGFDDLFARDVGHLVFGKPIHVEETREYEFKEVTSNRPIDTIANAADEYAVAFLNSQGGRIFWGVRNNDRVVVGVKLTWEERDRLRQIVTNKLVAIRPHIDPTAYRLEVHPVEHPDRTTDLVVVELVVPRVKATMPYFTGGNDAFVRLDGVKRKLVGPELSEWILRRVSST